MLLVTSRFVLCFSSAITSTEFPDYNIEMDLDVVKNPKHLETTVDLHYGADSKDMKKRILINNELDVTGNFKNLNVDHVAKLKWKAMVSAENHNQIAYGLQIA